MSDDTALHDHQKRIMLANSFASVLCALALLSAAPEGDCTKSGDCKQGEYCRSGTCVPKDVPDRSEDEIPF